MIKKVSNWVFGSFFRTMGRFFFFLFFGFLIAMIIQKNDWSTFKWTDLLGLEYVKAVTITQEVQKMETTIVTQVDGGGWTDTWGKYRANFGPSEDIRYINIVLKQDTGIIENRDYVEIPIVLSPPTDYEPINEIGCADYGYYTNPNGQVHYLCDSWYNGYTFTQESNFEELNFFIIMSFTDTSTAGCLIQNNAIVCPLGGKKPRELRFYFSYRNSNPKQVYLFVDRNWVWYNSANPSQAIQEQTNQTISTITDTNTTEASNEANNFFSGFTSQDNGGISSIITAPLQAISGLVSAQCVQIELPIPYLDNKTLILPCMSAIYQEHFGGIFTLYQTIIFGAIAYRMLVSLFMMIQGFKNPDDDKIEVVDL